MSENSKTQTAVENLISEIETKSAEHDLYLHRYQTNGSNHRTEITYVLHNSADKPARSAHCDGYEDAVFLGQIEGCSKRCEAFREMMGMLKLVNSL